MIHTFKEENKKGTKGEDRLLQYYPFLINKSCDGWDHIDTRVNKTIEVKTDFYDMNRTPNFFMERYSNDSTSKPGGPWRSMIYGADIFLYQFWSSETLFLFYDIAELIETLDAYIVENNLEMSFIKNKNYWTRGYKIPRTVLSHLYKKIRLGEPLPKGG